MDDDGIHDLIKSVQQAQERKKGGHMATPGRADIFSPKTFDEYIGQEKVKRMAQIWTKAAIVQRRGLPCILITGEFGTGKTSLAKLILHEYYKGLTQQDRWFTPMDASNLGLDKIDRLTRDFPTIVDEIHNLNSETQDSLNILIDAGAVAIIGCTTDSGSLTAPFRSRFRLLHLEPYTPEDLVKIIVQDVEKNGTVHLSDAQVAQIALRSRFNARAATQNLDMIFDLMAIYEMIDLTDEVMFEAFDLAGIDENGLRAIDRKYLDALNTQRPTGIQAIAQKIGADPHTIIEEIEPYLLRRGLIDRQPRGRIKIPTKTYGTNAPVV